MASQVPFQAPGPTTATPTKPPKPSTPISILPAQFARVYALVHPVILLSLLAFRFSSVIDDPVVELLNDLPYLAVLQILFAMACLPQAGAATKSGEKHGSSSSAPETRKIPGPPRRRGHASGPKGSSSGLSLSDGLLCVLSKLTPALLSLILTTLLATPVFSILLILFGAPLTTHHVLTALCAAHMALLSSLPLIYVHGVDGNVWREIWGAARPFDSVWGGALGTCLGAWLGAVPVPLDWDRPWQAYPTTILTGAYFGYCIGVLGGRVKGVFGKRIDFSSASAETGADIKVD